MNINIKDDTTIINIDILIINNIQININNTNFINI